MKRSLNRAERLHRLLKRGWLSSLDIILQCGTVKPTNAVSELRRSGVLSSARSSPASRAIGWRDGCYLRGLR